MALPFSIGKVAGIGLGLGLAGAIASLLVEALVFRAYLRWKSAQFGRLPKFQDGWPICGVAVIACVWFVNSSLSPILPIRGLFFCGLVVAVVVLERRRIMELLNLVRGIYRVASL